MESLSETRWDVLIAGTGVEQSLLALALSRSDKKVLHVDKNDFYGGPQAAFSLQEVEAWAKRVNDDETKPSSLFRHASITQPTPTDSGEDGPKLGFSRSYSLALAPQLLYSRSAILPTLVSSKVYRQVEFLAVGSWWVYSSDTESPAESLDASEEGPQSAGRLTKVPGGREDIFSDETIDFKAKRLLMKFLRFVGDYEGQEDVWLDYRAVSFADFLSDHFKIPKDMHGPLLALTLSLETPEKTTTEYALPRIANHLRSIGVFGPGFACVIPKWGGLAEISQVACRAQAVGGGIYVLGQGVTNVNTDVDTSPEATDDVSQARVSAQLTEGDNISTRWIAGSDDDLPSHVEPSDTEPVACSRSISIVSSTLKQLFPPLAEGAPAPAGAVVSFPTGSLNVDGSIEHPPVYVFVHTSDTGECPVGQTVLYAFASPTGERGAKLLNAAVAALLQSVDEEITPKLLWSMHYEQCSRSGNVVPATTHDSVFAFPPPSLELKFDDSMLDHVRTIWEKIEGDDADPAFFMRFEDREEIDDDDYE
ncbi:rab geranylgeranyl transferase escort protein [Diplodia corticola]|uniref:Rab proteins geranylgeranyltransferase n=1 Tax=Diplodia corticola TaxID=236234 RepID=A0A1J9R1N5_9PEZI|nr:rab geranylgeranyl transferase escort protein [Diplodia corticola]OJD35310.1 rab geranylgeranyl transferase escort protein [Diplodia corticola]